MTDLLIGIAIGGVSVVAGFLLLLKIFDDPDSNGGM